MRLYQSDVSSNNIPSMLMIDEYSFSGEETSLTTIHENKIKHGSVFKFNENNNSEYDETIGSMFLNVALAQENALAVIQMTDNVFEPNTLSYSQLYHQVQMLAHRLVVEYNIKVGDVICQCMERSLDMVIGLLGIMMAGAVYCPLNPTDPKDRLSFLIESTQARLVLIHHSTEHIFQYVNKKNDMLIFNYKDYLIENNQMKQPALIDNRATGSDMAYIIFTSGSTGKPKGVPISHSNFLNHWRGIHQAQYNDKPLRFHDDVTLAMGLATFDISLNEILCPLLLGNHFIMLPPRGHLDSGYIVDTIEIQKVTQLFAVPSALRTLLDFVEKQQCSHRLASLRSVWCGGEMVNSQLARQFYRNVPSSSTVDFVNVYGPTECTILTSYHRVTKTDIERDLLPIGRTFLNYSCQILDEHYAPVSQGSVGELFIGGQGVFNGYLITGNEEDIVRLQTLNARVLIDIPNLNSQSIGNHHNKFYRTGDLCRLNDDGEIIFVGRVDHQVKLRGQRLELGEIEACISAVPFVTYCVASKCLDQATRHEFLAAYVECPSFSSSSSSSSSSLSMKENIQQHCRAYLPAYMVPSVIVIMDHLPLNGNGKVNRKQLPIPEIDRNITSKYWEYKEPSSELECIVHTHWSTVLGIDQISIYANFFKLGGNSLSLMRLIGDYRTAGLIKPNTISTDQFFKETTLIEHVHLLEKQGSSSQSIDDTIDNDPWLPLGHDEADASAAQERIWLDEQLRYSKSAKYAMYNVVIPIIVGDNDYTINKYIELDRIHRALLAVIRRHKVLRTCIRHETNSIKQYVNPMLEYLHPEQHDQFYSFIESAYSTEDELQQILSNEVLDHVFRIEEGLVVRFHLIRRSIENIGKNQLYNGDVMAFNIHHAAIDGESKVLFLRDLQLAYHDEQIFGKRGGEDLFQYIDFSIHESRLLQVDSGSSSLSEARAYWKRSLAGCLDKNLSICRSRVPMDIEDGHGNYLFDLSTDLVADLVSLAVTHNLSLYQMFLAAYVLFIYKLTGEQDICVGGVTANHYRSEQDDLIGMFVNLLPYRVQIDNNNDDLQSYYAKVHQLCLDFMRYGQLPLQEIVKLHRTSHDQLHHSPFFQTTLAFYSNTAASHLGTCSFDDVLCKAVTLPVSVVKFDLCLVINHTLTNNTDNRYQQHNMLCKWEYSTRLYEENEIQILTERFTSFLTSLIDAEKMTQLSVLISRDFKVFRQLNDTHINFADSIILPSIDANFGVHVRNNPSKTAVICDGSCFTYHEINQKAIKLAAYLLESYNIRRGDVIIQCVGRSVEMVIGILAILKVQGIYCPLNPADPSRRHISLINNIKARVVLCDRSTYPAFQMINENTEKDHDPIILVDVTEVLLSTTETTQSLPQPSTTTADDLAYIVYTSGSTGNPKAVPISNGNFLACIRGMQHLQMINSSDTIVQITECSYDVHLMELLGCLVTGGTLVMLKQHGNLDMVYLANIIEQYKATWAIIVPTLALSLYEQISSSIEYSNKLRSLTTCISGGKE